MLAVSNDRIGANGELLHRSESRVFRGFCTFEPQDLANPLSTQLAIVCTNGLTALWWVEANNELREFYAEAENISIYVCNAPQMIG